MDSSKNKEDKPKESPWGVVGSLLLSAAIISGGITVFNNPHSPSNQDNETTIDESVPYGVWDLDLIDNESQTAIIYSTASKAIVHEAQDSKYLTSKTYPALNEDSLAIETWGNYNLFNFSGVDTSSWYIDDMGIWRDKDGYVIVAIPKDYPYSNDIPKYQIGDIIPTSNGDGKAYTKSNTSVVLNSGGVNYQVLYIVTDWTN